MLRIPYVPTAYPDELLASLLTRLILHNGSGLWRSLLEESGYGRRTISPFFAPQMQDDKFDRLLAALGYTYSDMLRELTVLPFWMAFNNATDVRFQVRLDTSQGPLTTLSRLGSRQVTPGARYCPSCLTEDTETYGEPYLHRQHQLPVVIVCPRHGAMLRFSCPGCRFVV
ncbi:TniQ family protein, partial [Nostoc sp. NIES-2111]